MRFEFDRAACRKVDMLRREWLLTNGLGEYASGTLPACNTRRYHGMLVANLAQPAGRYVLLSTLDASVMAGDQEYCFSCRKHPDGFYPDGHEYLEYVETGDWPLFRYRIGPLLITREIVMVRGKTILLVRYTVKFTEEQQDDLPLSLRVKPLLAYRKNHELARINTELNAATSPVTGKAAGFMIQPYDTLPPLYMQVQGAENTFSADPEWCRDVQYMMDAERGCDDVEDLFIPGHFDIPIKAGISIVMSASTAPITTSLELLWQSEIKRRRNLTAESADLAGHLHRECARFLVHEADSPLREHGTAVVTAGYHWYDVRGRDTFIALPGLTFAEDRLSKGQELFITAGCQMKDGVFPCLFSGGGRSAVSTSVDASLWYVWAVQEMLRWAPEMEEFAYIECWPRMQSIITAFKRGIHSPDGTVLARIDEDGLLYSGSDYSRFTWMDAAIKGRPVTPRQGCAVEVNALWFNALAFANEMAERWGESQWSCPELLPRLREAFRRRFWVEDGQYLADLWLDGVQDRSIRPNQLLAVSLPNAPLPQEDWEPVLRCVRDNLLTPYGLRSLAPQDPAYKGRCEGTPAQRAAACHQGTVWPWWLGPYADALLKTAPDAHVAAAELLDTVTPLFSSAMMKDGLGCISEYFNGDAPHKAGGCIAQAVNVAECCRLLNRLQEFAPKAYVAWEEKVMNLLHKPEEA